MDMSPQQEFGLVPWLRQKFAAAYEELRRIFLLPHDPAELFISMFAVTFGGTLIMPGDSFGVSPLFFFMIQWGPDWKWGLGIFALGILQFVAFFCRIFWLRRWSMFCASLFWTMLALQFALVFLWATATSTYTVIAIGAIVTYARLERDKRS